jgi:hypothetical protein
MNHAMEVCHEGLHQGQISIPTLAPSIFHVRHFLCMGFSAMEFSAMWFLAMGFSAMGFSAMGFFSNEVFNNDVVSYGDFQLCGF